MKKVIKGTNLETIGTDTLMLDPKIVPDSYDVPTTAAVATAVTDILDDHDTATQDEELTMPAAEAANYTVGNYFEQDGEIWKCTAKTDNGDGTWTVEAEKVNGVVPVLNELNNESDALQEQIDDIAEKAGSGYTPKGPASVATLNGLTGQESGWLYTMTDAGTLTDGSIAVVAGDTVAWDATNSVWYKAMDYAPSQYGTNEVHNLPTTITAFRTGDVIPVDGPDGPAKMSKDDLLAEMTKDSVLKEFVPSNTSVVEKSVYGDGYYITASGNLSADAYYGISIPYLLKAGETVVFNVCSGWTGTNSFPIFKTNQAVVDENSTFESLGVDAGSVGTYDDYKYTNNTGSDIYVVSNNRYATPGTPRIYIGTYRQDAPTFQEFNDAMSDKADVETYEIFDGYDRYFNGVGKGINEYYLDASGVLHADVNYFVTDSIELKDGEKISCTDVVNNVAYPLFKASTKVITTSTTFVALGTGKTTTPSYTNSSGSTIYVVLCLRLPNPAPAHYTITKKGVDAPTYEDFKILNERTKGINGIDALKYYAVESYGVIASDGSYNNSSNYEHVEFRREPWMKKLSVVASNDTLNRLNVAFFTTPVFDKNNCAAAFISGERFYGTDVECVVDIPDNCNYIYISSLKSYGNIKKIAILGDYDDLSVLSFNKDLVDKIYASNMTRGVKPVLSLLHFSDIHGVTRNLENVVKVQNYFSDIISDVVDTGDDVHDQFSDPDIFAGVAGAEKILRCIGNHDNAVKTGGVYDFNAKTAAECYGKFFAPYIDDWGVTYTTDKCYYYKDYPTQGVRLVVLDVMHNDSTQETWLDTVLDDAKTNGLAVICANHYPRVIDGYNTPFNDASPAANSMPEAWASSVDSFIAGGGEFVCWLCGHTHKDSVGTIQGHQNQVMIVIDTSATGRSETSNTYRKFYTRSQDLMNVISVDRNNTTIKVVRIGARERDDMQVIDSMVIDYSTRTLVR